MDSRNVERTVKLSVIITLIFWLAAVSVNYGHRLAYPLELKEEIRFLPQQEVVEVLCLDHRGLAADMLFIQAVLHSGSLMWKPRKFKFDSRWSYGVMDVATKLDPRYLSAYLFTGMGLVHGVDDVHLAFPILKRGMTYFPENWEIPFWVGYLHHIYLEDYETAGEYFWRAVHCPNSPKSFLSLALSSLKKSGSYERAIVLLEALIESTDNDQVKEIYQSRIRSFQNMLMLQEAARVYSLTKGGPLANLNQLLEDNLVPGIPEDPFGKTYVWDSKNNRVVTSN